MIPILTNVMPSPHPLEHELRMKSKESLHISCPPMLISYTVGPRNSRVIKCDLVRHSCLTYSWGFYKCIKKCIFYFFLNTSALFSYIHLGK